MKPTPPALLLDRTTVSELLTLDDCITAVEQAFAAHARGESLHPGLLHGDGVDGEFHTKAGGLRSPNPVYACKVNGGFFKNKERFGLPAIQGLILLYDATNGVPLAVMDSGAITRLRTGAATAVAAKYLARADSRVATICGAGVQAFVQLQALLRVTQLEEIHVWSRDPRRAADFCEMAAKQTSVPVKVATELGQATRASDIIVTCTPSKAAFLGIQHVNRGTFVAAVGADSPDKQEIEPGLLARSSVFCDLHSQCVEVGDTHHAIEAELMTKADVCGELGNVIIGRIPGRRSADEVTIFDSTGTSLQDVAAAALVHRRAVAEGRGTSFSFSS